MSNGNVQFDCNALIEQTRAASVPFAKKATLGTRVTNVGTQIFRFDTSQVDLDLLGEVVYDTNACTLQDVKRQLPMFTYTSPGFGRVMQKLMKKRKIRQSDIVDPHDFIGQDVKYVYKFKGKSPTIGGRYPGRTKDPPSLSGFLTKRIVPNEIRHRFPTESGRTVPEFRTQL